ncbi:uncharacterized protein LOC129262970 [Lytechinus pictus]|uniref:uncharacterized protein LOC129262970 n=1 Tax=Lytechinus pictus TaxID=7653 RepID=UPI0030BA2959
MVTPCPINPEKPASFPGNSYYCPATNEDGSPNTFTECCQNDRADDDGNLHSCCLPAEEQNAEMLGMMEQVGLYLGVATAVLIVLVFLYTYCRDDTFSCLKRLRARIYKFWDGCMDGLCNCRCVGRRIRRKLKKKSQPETPYVKESNHEHDGPAAEHVGVQENFFW